MLPMNGMSDKGPRKFYIDKRRREIVEELSGVAKVRHGIEQSTKPRYEPPVPALPAPPMFGGITPHKIHSMGGPGKKRPAVTPLGQTQSLAAPEPAPGPLSESNKRQRIEGEREKRVSAFFSQCLTILKQVSKLKDASPFLKPVDPIALKCPDYLQIIKHPMDFGTIQKKLEHKPDKGIFRQYKDPADFVSDMRLVFDNCRSYNAPNHAVRKMGDTISEIWEKKWKLSGLQEKWEAERVRQAEEDRVGPTFKKRRQLSPSDS
jgi:hypothetical protein